VIDDGKQLQLERQQAGSRNDTGSHRNGDSASYAVLTSSDSQQPLSAADSQPLHHEPPETTDFAAVSLDDAWKTLSTSAVPVNGKYRRHLLESSCDFISLV